MKQQFGSLIPGFILLTVSACMAEDNVIPYNDYVAISSSGPAIESHSSRRNDSVRTSPPAKKVIPAQYQHIFGPDYQKWLNPSQQIGEYVRRIFEDKAGNLWFGTNGEGVFFFDGKNYIHYTKADGLCDNSITSIVQDRKGNIWFGTMNGGISLFDGTSFSSFTEKNGMIGNNEVWNIYEDKKGNIWFSSEGFGVYRYDGEKLVNFGEKEGLGIKAVQTIYEDSKGRLWIGGGGGLYRFDGKDTFFNVTRDGLVDGC